MNLYLRIWLPVSLVAHVLLYLLVRALPPFPVTSLATPPMKIVMIEMEKTAKGANIAKPLATPPVKPPPIIPSHITPPKQTLAKSTQLAWNAPQKLVNQLPARDPRLSTGGGYRADPFPGNLPKLNAGPAPNRTEGWADRPDAHGNGSNPLDMLRPARGGAGHAGNGGTLGTATALLPGAPLPASAVGGSAGSTGGHGSPFPGNGPLGAGNLPAIAGAGLTAPHGAGSLTLEHAGPAGGAGHGPGGMMAGGPRRPGNYGSTLSGPPGTSLGLQPGSAPGFGHANGGGAQGSPGFPFGGSPALAGLPDSSASGGSPRGITGATDHPGAGGGPGSGIGGQGPRIGKPSYAAAAISGPPLAYPHLALTENLHGTVKMKVFLNRHAEVVNVEFLPGGRSMSAILDNAAKNNVKLWHYRGQMIKGQLVASTVIMEATFVLGQPPVIKEMR